MIIVEGPDGAGKSTVVKRLAADLDIPVAPRVVDKDTNAMVDLKRWVEDNLDQGLTPVIFDRHRLISELIYGPLFGRVAPGFDDPDWLLEVRTSFEELQPLVLWCMPSLETVTSNIMTSPENSILQDLDLINTLYDEYRLECRGWCQVHDQFLYDYESERSETQYDHFVENARLLLKSL